MATLDRPLALVTGASSGIGAEFARRYAREGFDLLLVARSEGALHALADELSDRHGITASVHPADLSNPTHVSQLVEVVTSLLPRLDHVVNSAGTAPEGDLDRMDPDELRRMVDINVTALTLLTRAAVIRMREAGRGTIINIASGAGYQPLPHFSAYAASKAYVLSLTEALSEEHRPHGLRIFSVAPGDTDTPMNPGPGKNKRRARDVVDTAWRAMPTRAPSVVDGRMNAVLALLSTRVFTKRFGLRTAEKMMRSKA
ncbi:SDR family NAD(P)-dependent oxidoreductase [Rathayibacter sp. VKM Ac-2803]|uniref:SDR family NAD(P)-dependent oxidoreductase n=1 Tax=Rathayibacter sp. VKM Ac-2803 TaxID=2609256 RepID=UPI00135C48E0|nr:SDR family NAD(P)-dependent oxidoreductase [Rathayibacter sp. VKM Ac-2803]MWV47969.1 SDR family NAD(P)-dependent oxidoreductase [Rathayibacter sp. VKM Ac-2803]